MTPPLVNPFVGVDAGNYSVAAGPDLERFYGRINQPPLPLDGSGTRAPKPPAEERRN
jgi:hypothetical protein